MGYHRYEKINPDLFVQNRERFTRRMAPRSLAIFFSNDCMPRNGDVTFPFRQNSELFALSGLDQEESILVLFPEAAKEDHRGFIFVRKTDSHTRTWEGNKYSKEDARAISGINKVYWSENFEKVIREFITEAEIIYLNSAERPKFAADILDRNTRMAAQLRTQFPLHQYARAQPIMKELTMIKLDLEVALIRKAVEITGHAFRRILPVIRPGLREFEIEAEITAEFIRHGATGHAYSPIIASGANACVLHYTHNAHICHDGTMILMDFGAEYANYAADLTRTVPVNGRFTDRQRAVYNAVLRVQKEAIQRLVPGTELKAYEKEIGRIMQSELIGLGLLSRKEVAAHKGSKPLYRNYYMHGTSHHLGRDVHDLSIRGKRLEPGMVLTCEPGIYIAEEGLGIRLENDILITNDGPLDLMHSIPIEVEEIEDLMHSA